MNTNAIIPTERLTEFAKRWHISELSLFGSILREDFRPDSDVDVCVVTDPRRVYDIDDLIAMREELSDIFGGRDIDMVERKLITNPFMRHRVITTRRVIYAAREKPIHIPALIPQLEAILPEPPEDPLPETESKR